jgi:hypothetical protein
MTTQMHTTSTKQRQFHPPAEHQHKRTPTTKPTEDRFKIKVKLYLSLTNYTLSHEDVWGSGYIDSRILDLGNSWR